MSFSFTVSGPSKKDALAEVVRQIDAVVAQQPSHSKDRDAVVEVSAAYIDMLGDLLDGQQIIGTVNGSLSWTYNDDGTQTYVSSAVSATFYVSKLQG